MAPYLEEVDVFTIPHSRMKQLVEGYCNKLSITDFANHEATNALLRSLYSTFREFKSHETIENELIMRKLKNRLATIPYNEPGESATVCNCHSDNRLTEMLQLVVDGYALSNNTVSSAERIDYGRRLEAALQEFTSIFLPHMAEEEAIFQPMLIKYFAYEELINLKKRVIELHENLVQQLEENIGLEKFRLDEDEHDGAECEEEEEISSFDVLPNEIVHKIFSYLCPPDLGRCARVCSKWRAITRKPGLWKKVFPSQWARNDWTSQHGLYYPQEHPNFWQLETLSCGGSKCGGCRLRDVEADIDESEPDSGGFCASRGVCRKEVLAYKREKEMIEKISEYILPYVGIGVSHVSFAGCMLLHGNWLSPVLSCCPNLVHLDLSYTLLYDEIIYLMKEDLVEKRTDDSRQLCPRLSHLNLTGCSSLSDSGLAVLLECLLYSNRTDRLSGGHLKILNLCGCSQLTDQSLQFLLEATLIPSALCEFDLSGCWALTGGMLCRFTAKCANLDPQKLSYCDLIVDGPYQKTANGCQNLESSCLFCCCSVSAQ